MTRCKYRSECGTLCVEDLAICDRKLTAVWLILVNARREFRFLSDQIRNTSSVVAMPVREKNMRDV